MSRESNADVIVAGSGNAAMSAALAAAEAGASVVVLEKAPRAEAGGNTWYTAGAYRTPHGGIDDLGALLSDPADARLAATELSSYAEADFRADLERLTDGRCDPLMADVLVGDARGSIDWLHGHGVGFELMYHRQAYALDGGGHRFWGNLALGVVGGGKGLVAQQLETARALGVEVVYEAGVVGLERDGDGAIAGVETADGRRWAAPAVVLACGGFQADPALRARHLGDRWRAAKVRGTGHNTGEALLAALDAGAARAGDWGSCHSVAWDVDAPPHGGDRELTNRFTKQSYPLGIVVNLAGERFVDEGSDFRNYTYARLGAAIIEQPQATAVQLFDGKTKPLLRDDEYTVPGIVRHEAGDLRSLARAAGIDPDGLERTVRAFNAAVRAGPFDPTAKDGKGTDGIEPPKSNWAQPLDRAPYVAVTVTCGITFTFGGLRIDADGRVLDERAAPIAGLFAAGEIAGGLFAGNYPGGSGLTAGTVFGRRAGHSAATAVIGPDPAPRAAGAQQEGVAS
ncbi:FAD-dependent tricarballylate dehydrogenase TcuA [Conexibacter stalactiti]|uniref:FAD-dependent tricarballylate dehydrogenase TcuA n=1 Tax=Conexibacter stalactiti TaxID=1940611 RepID=A0ABU4HT27_9ACTN|nr:FAD-dependent tricarballylate dehydrogenase TcuA [Conexibacter stalactiti]MDW5596400.1 FAD-dependent tricarballylate dehydrogenase TcuA [Conexibacter stalactiti]MEC5037042.1 FAD-dependent tricarballylate dehydrogenase TcuA [Conexibacter stalactiti]